MIKITCSVECPGCCCHINLPCYHCTNHVKYRDKSEEEKYYDMYNEEDDGDMS